MTYRAQTYYRSGTVNLSTTVLLKNMQTTSLCFMPYKLKFHKTSQCIFQLFQLTLTDLQIEQLKYQHLFLSLKHSNLAWILLWLTMFDIIVLLKWFYTSAIKLWVLEHYAFHVNISQLHVAGRYTYWYICSQWPGLGICDPRSLLGHWSDVCFWGVSGIRGRGCVS